MLSRPVGKGEPLNRGAPLYRESASPRGGVRLAHTLLVLWIIYVAISPIYLFPSGNPQIADAVLALLIMLLATRFFIPIAVHSDLYMFGGIFLCIIVFVNGFSWAVYRDHQFLLSAIYYIYNFSIVVLVISLFRRFREHFVVATSAALIIAALIELAAVVLLTGDRLRAVGTFNNPNQLGYWSLLAATCFLVLKGGNRLGPLDLVVLLTFGYFSTLSLSKGAALGFLFLLLSAMYFQGIDRRRGLVVILFALLLGAAALALQPERVQGFFAEGLPAQFADRFEGDSVPDDAFFAERGYDRLWNYPQYLIFGAGEGAYWRFSPLAGWRLQGEIHSSFATILFSYGVLGATAFALFLWVIFRGASIRYLIFFLPICFYGLTHQGLRASLLWVFFGLVFAMARYGDQAPVPARRKTTASGARRL